jgi:Domain of unknown function (DUF4383)
MEAPSPARLYATFAGALLVVLGILGFFYDASFGPLDHYEDALGALQVNAWLNLFYIATGAIGLLVAGVSSRSFSLATGLLYTVLAIVGWGTGALQLVIGLLGLAAAAGTPKPRGAGRQKRGSLRSLRARKEPRNSKPRAKAARDRA